MLGPAGSAEDECCVSPAPGGHQQHQCCAGEGFAATGSAAPLVRAVLRAFRAAHLHHLLAVHEDEQRPCFFGTQSPAHHRYHHPQRWVEVTAVINILFTSYMPSFCRLCCSSSLNQETHLIHLPERSRGDMASKWAQVGSSKRLQSIRNLNHWKLELDHTKTQMQMLSQNY